MDTNFSNILLEVLPQYSKFDFSGDTVKWQTFQWQGTKVTIVRALVLKSDIYRINGKKICFCFR